MRDKSAVASGYLEQTKNRYQHNKFPANHFVAMTGDGRKNSIGEEIRDTLQLQGNTTQSLEGDIRDNDNRSKLISSHQTALICCHGITHLDWFEDQTEASIKDQIEINLTYTAVICSEFVNATITNGFKKKIILIGSMAHKAVLNGSAAYCASKAGVVMLSRCLAWELAPKGYDVFVINPSNTQDTPMTEDTIEGLQRYRNLSRSEAEGYWGASLPKQRWLQKYDISSLVSFLLSGQSEYLSGAVLDLPGGQR